MNLPSIPVNPKVVAGVVGVFLATVVMAVSPKDPQSILQILIALAMFVLLSFAGIGAVKGFFGRPLEFSPRGYETDPVEFDEADIHLAPPPEEPPVMEVRSVAASRPMRHGDFDFSGDRVTLGVLRGDRDANPPPTVEVMGDQDIHITAPELPAVEELNDGDDGDDGGDDSFDPTATQEVSFEVASEWDWDENEIFK